MLNIEESYCSSLSSSSTASGGWFDRIEIGIPMDFFYKYDWLVTISYFSFC